MTLHDHRAGCHGGRRAGGSLSLVNRRLSEVAQKVGVSEATVSRVLNHKPGVSKETRLAVLTALDVLGYERPTQLREDRGRLVGLVLPELSNPIFPAVAEVVGSALAQKGLTPLLCTQTVGGASEAEYIELLLSQRVSGVVFAGGLYSQRNANHQHYHRIAERGLPVVLLNASIDTLPFPRVSSDDAVAVDQTFAHLTALGHTRIGLLLGPPDHVPSERKLVAARAAAARVGRTVAEDEVATTAYSLESGQAGAARLLRAGVTGIVCASDVLALGAVRAARRSGLRVPEDVSVVGYDDSALMTCTDPPLTTNRQPIDAMGRAAVSLLVALMEGGTAADDELLYETELVVRGSTGPATGSETAAAAP